MKNIRIIPCDSKSIPTLAQLHSTIIPGSHIVQLGFDFLTRVFYPTLLQGEHGGALIAYYGDDAVGFVAFSYNTEKFIAAVAQKRFKIAKAIVKEFICNPSILSIIIKSMSYSRNVTNEPFTDVSAEYLSMGVIEEYRRTEFIRKNKIYLAKDLFTACFKPFQEKGIDSFRILTKADNSQANIFYQMLGAKKHFNGFIRGEKGTIYIYTIKSRI